MALSKKTISPISLNASPTMNGTRLRIIPGNPYFADIVIYSTEQTACVQKAADNQRFSFILRNYQIFVYSDHSDYAQQFHSVCCPFFTLCSALFFAFHNIVIPIPRWRGMVPRTAQHSPRISARGAFYFISCAPFRAGAEWFPARRGTRRGVVSTKGAYHSSVNSAMGSKSG